MLPRCLLPLALCLAIAPPAAGASQPGSLPVVSGDYPRVFFFRSSEGAAANPAISYERWDREFSRLMGIEGKVLDEEIPERSKRNIDFFTRFKKQHPDQVVLLHYNGNARDPRYELEPFFAGHFLYHNGATVLADVAAEEGETEIAVSNVELFRTGMGRYKTSNDDIGLCLLNEQGRPDWRRSEQVQLVSIDRTRKTIRVRRGCYGTRPIALPGGKSYAAAHVTEGPWGARSNILWYYNYSTCCPKDDRGRTCGDVHAEALAAKFLPGGELEVFDGLEFDVLHHELGGRGRLGADCDADGRIDNGLVDGRNQYGLGVVEFCRALRARLGRDRLILADGFSLRNQRVFRILNGIESEGWPALNDWEIRDWSGGLNRHQYWAENGAPPVWNYVNHKFTTAGEKPGQTVTPDVPWNIHRLVFAAAMFTDSAICYSFAPPGRRGEALGVWDEFWQGGERKLGWLGKPLGPAVRTAEQHPNLLDRNAHEKLVAVKGDGTTRLRIKDIPCSGPDLFVTVTAMAEHRAHEPPEIARRMWVGIVADCGPNNNATTDHAYWGRAVVVGPEAAVAWTEPVRHMTWVGDRPFTSGFYFSEIRSKSLDLELVIEGEEPVRIESIGAHAAPDAVYRVFQRGLVLANPSPRPHRFDLEQIAPGKHFRRLKGTELQDTVANNGRPVGATVSLQPQEGLFLVLDK